MFEKFFMPDTDDDTARDKWNNLNRQVNRENAANYKIPIESVRYENNERVALDRVGELSSYIW